MAVSAQAGTVGFGPQEAMGTRATEFYRHKATMVDLSILDDTRLGVPEVGGRPVPTFPYKAGIMVAGGLTIQPRLENTLGWLLRGLMGGYTSDGIEDEDGVQALTALDGSTITDGSLVDPSEARFITMSVILDEDLPSTPAANVVITGDTVDYTYHLAGLSSGSHIFCTPDEIADVSQIVLPTASGSAMFGWTKDNDVDANVKVTHEFTLLDSDPGYVPWMTFKKHIPRKENASDTDLGEIYDDCKVLTAGFVFPNDAPITMRLDALGRDFELDHSPDAWVWENTFEDYQSIPVGCVAGGYIEIPDGTELPVVAANLAMGNAPLDLRQERVFGDYRLEDVTVINRAMTFDILVKWNDPDLYAQVLTGSTTGSSWIEDPFVSTLDLMILSTGDIPGVTPATPYSLRIQSPSVMLGQVGGITLAGNQAVMLRFQGTALDNDSYYAKFTLVNKHPFYGWPR